MSKSDEKNQKKRKIIKYISFTILGIVILWFVLVLGEFFRVRIDKKPLICFNAVKDIEDDDEYSITCYGILYKYREYYYNEDNEMSAKEFTLVFKEFSRKIDN